MTETDVTLALPKLHKEPREILRLAGHFDGLDATITFEDLEDAVCARSERRS